jgi:ACT domain-containing protein
MLVTFMGRELVVITIIGLDKTGIVAAVSNILAENNVNIEDISQTILDKYFAMIMLVDTSKSKISLEELQKKLNEKGVEMNLEIKVQHENVFKAIHRI